MRFVLCAVLLTSPLTRPLALSPIAQQQDAAKVVQPAPAAGAVVAGVAAEGAGREAQRQDAAAGVRLPAGTRVELEMAHTIDSQTTRKGDAVSFRVVNPVVVGGVMLIAVGATATALVVKAERNGHFGRAGRIVWELKEVTATDGSRVPLAASGRAVGDSKGAKVAALMALERAHPLRARRGLQARRERGRPRGQALRRRHARRGVRRGARAALKRPSPQFDNLSPHT